jgi:hypothetical protein
MSRKCSNEFIQATRSDLGRTRMAKQDWDANWQAEIDIRLNAIPWFES